MRQNIVKRKETEIMNLRLHFYVCLLPVIHELYFNNGAAVTEQIKIFATFCSFLCHPLSPCCSGGETFQGSGAWSSRGLSPDPDLGGKKAIYSLESRLLVTSANVSYKN